MAIRSTFENDGRAPSSGNRELDLVALRRTISLRRWWILVPALICCLCAAVYVSVVQPRFTGQAKVLVENGENYFTKPDRTDQLAATLPDDEAVQSQIQLAQSRDIARQAIRRLDLKGNPIYDPAAQSFGPVSRLLVLLGLERDPTADPSEDRILANYYDRLTVFSVPKSRVIVIEFAAPDADFAARAANTIAELFIEAQQSAKRDTASASAASLASLITDLRTRVADAEAKADQYRTQSGLLLGNNSTTITAQQLGDLNTQLAQARTAQADSQAKAKIIKEMIRENRVGEIPDVANNELIRRIAEQRATLKSEIALQSRTLLPGHPHMQELNAQLADVDAQIRAAGEKAARTLENDARIAAGRVDNLQAAMDVQKKTVGTAGADQVKLDALMTQSRLLKDQLEFNVAKYQEAVARETAAATPADARVISRAVPPELPTFPKKLPIIAIATIAGLMLALGIVVARELLSGRPFAAADAAAPTRTLTAVPVQVAAPDRRFAREDEAEGDANLVAALDALRSRRSTDRAARALVLPPSARTAVPAAALSVARRLSGESRTILIDFDRRNPVVDPNGLAGGSGLSSSTEPLGLTDLLAGKASFAEVIHRDAGSRLHVVPAGRLEFESDGRRAIDLVLGALGETYETIVMNAPAPTDSLTLDLAAEADVVMMVHAGEWSIADVEAARAALARDAAARDGRAPALYPVPASALDGDRFVRRAA